MSEWQAARIPRLRLVSFEPLKEALGLKGFKRPSEHLTSSARVNALGDSISEHLGNFRKNFKQLSGIKDLTVKETITSIEKGISLTDALSEDRHSLLNALVRKELSKDGSGGLDVLKKARTMLEKNDLKSLTALHSDIDIAVSKLSKLSKEAHIKLAQVEHKVIVDKTEETMNALGYQVKKKAKKEGCLIRAKKNDLSIAARVTSEGELHIDMAGFEGGDCRKELDRLNAELSKRGIELNITKREYHGKKSGGVLIQEVEKEMAPEFNPIREPETKGKKLKSHLQRLMKLSHLRQRIHR